MKGIEIMSEDIDRLADQVAAEITSSDYHEPLSGYRLVDLIRAVVRDEIRQAGERAQAAQQAATQAHWDSDGFKAEVDRLRQGRPVVPGVVPGCGRCGTRLSAWGSCPACVAFGH